MADLRLRHDESTVEARLAAMGNEIRGRHTPLPTAVADIVHRRRRQRVVASVVAVAAAAAVLAIAALVLIPAPRKPGAVQTPALIVLTRAAAAGELPATAPGERTTSVGRCLSAGQLRSPELVRAWFRGG